MAYHQNPPLATAVPIPAQEAAGEYTISRKSTDVDESMARALNGQGFSRGMCRHIGDEIRVELLQIILSCSHLNLMPAPLFTSTRPCQVAGTKQCNIPTENLGGGQQRVHAVD